MEKNIWTDCERNEDVLLIVKEEEANIQYKMERLPELVTSCVGAAF